MKIAELLESHRVATNADLPQIANLAEEKPTSVRVRDIHNCVNYDLTEVAQGPFSLEGSGIANWVLVGEDLDGNPAQMRISSTGVVEVLTINHEEWFAPAMASIRIYLPKDH